MIIEAKDGLHALLHGSNLEGPVHPVIESALRGAHTAEHPDTPLMIFVPVWFYAALIPIQLGMQEEGTLSKDSQVPLLFGLPVRSNKHNPDLEELNGIEKAIALKRFYVRAAVEEEESA